jgi:phosphoadenosine phosphosulfate reductase
MQPQEQLKKYQDELRNLSLSEKLKWALKTFGADKLVLASSLGVEDQLLTKEIIELDNKARIFTLDTGRMFQENYLTIDATSEKYNFKFEICFPETEDVKNLLQTKGASSFYNSIEDRKECCRIRKIAPLRKKLATADCWMTGLRASQSVTRTDMEFIEWDEGFELFKLNPLLDWSEEQVWETVKSEAIPYNPLHDEGFPSIGCAPCTRAVKEGEDLRAGRWWWEMADQKECGLHFKDGKMVRTQKSDNSGIH